MTTDKARNEVCGEILEIMETYDKNVASGRLGTPGGLEHMGDVWRLLGEWDNMLGRKPTKDMD